MGRFFSYLYIMRKNIIIVALIIGITFLAYQHHQTKKELDFHKEMLEALEGEFKRCEDAHRN